MDLVKKIGELKKKRGAVILAHNYQPDEIQDIADYVGDSLELSILAKKTPAKIILFCGVRFMAETASILSPDKTVLIPDKDAGCPLADMVDKDSLKKFREDYPGAPVVAYVNTTAEVKADSDICCTSANSIKVVNSLPQSEIIFVPDKHLAEYTASKISDKRIIPYPGYCPVHMKILPEDILKVKKKHPEAEVIVHPECTSDVIKLADEVLSTGGMVKYAKESKAKEFIIGTEVGMLYRLRKENPGKSFYPASESAICSDMKLTTLKKVLDSLSEMKYEVKVPEAVRKSALKAVASMLNL